MSEGIIKKPILTSCVFFLICMTVRIFEYFVLRTDETAVGENFIHKVFGIVLLFCILKTARISWRDIGFKRKHIFGDFLQGVLLGIYGFTIGYFLEMGLLFFWGKEPHFELFVSSFSVTGSYVKNTGVLFLFLCLFFNLINVWMEEGVFRGLFLTLINNRYSFAAANFVAALLFGVWHWVMPVRGYLDGSMKLETMLIMGIGYLLLSAMISVKWGLLYRMSGSLWIGLGDHLFHNLIATNLLHVVTAGSIDELQIVRILAAQSVSFLLVCTRYKKRMEFER